MYKGKRLLNSSRGRERGREREKITESSEKRDRKRKETKHLFGPRSLGCINGLLPSHIFLTVSTNYILRSEGKDSCQRGNNHVAQMLFKLCATCFKLSCSPGSNGGLINSRVELCGQPAPSAW